MRKILLIFILALVVQELVADQPRLRYSFKSANGYFELKPSDTIFSDNKVYTDSIYNPKTKQYFISSYRNSNRYYWSLYDLRTNKKLFTIKNPDLLIEFKTALVANDGQGIVIIDDYPSFWGYPNMEVVHFYEADELIKTLTLGDLLENRCSISKSISHMKWCFSFNLTQQHHFSIKTYELYHYEFDLQGNLIEKVSDSSIKLSDAIVVAKITCVGKNEYLFEIGRTIRGKQQVGEQFIVKASNKTMKHLHGRRYGLFPNTKKKMQSTFIRTVLLRDKKPIISDVSFPNYNVDEGCNKFKT